MTIQNETREERIARLGAVKGHTTGKQVAFKANYRASRYGALKPLNGFCDDATNMMHFEADAEGKHIDVYFEKDELIEALTLMGWL